MAWRPDVPAVSAVLPAVMCTVLPAAAPAVVPSSLRSAMATMETPALMRKSSPTAIIPIPMHHRTAAGATTSR